MIDKIKSFFLSFFAHWKAEEVVIKACNRAIPLHRKVSNVISCIFLVIAIIVWLCAFPSSAEEGIIPLADVPTDLTGYTVTVPVGWTSTSGYAVVSHVDSSFDLLDGDLVRGTFNGIALGYVLNFDTGSLSASANRVMFGNMYGYGEGPYIPSNSLVLSNFTGDFATDSTLIQWFVDNNATFVDNDPYPNPLVTFNKGLYKVSSTWYNSDISTQLDGMEFYSLSEGDLFTSLTVQNDELIFDDENGDMHVMARNTTTGAKWIDNSGQFVYFINDESIPQSLAEQIPTLLEYIPDVSLTEYQRMQDSWYYGVQDGFTEGYNQASRDTEGTFLGNIFGGVFDALDKFQMFGQFSFLDFIKSIIGILALIWFLKLLAGG